MSNILGSCTHQCVIRTTKKQLRKDFYLYLLIMFVSPQPTKQRNPKDEQRVDTYLIFSDYYQFENLFCNLILRMSTLFIPNRLVMYCGWSIFCVKAGNQSRHSFNYSCRPPTLKRWPVNVGCMNSTIVQHTTSKSVYRHKFATTMPFILTVVLAPAAHILKLERYREDQHGPCARMTRKFVKRSKFFILAL